MKFNTLWLFFGLYVVYFILYRTELGKKFIEWILKKMC